MRTVDAQELINVVNSLKPAMGKDTLLMHFTEEGLTLAGLDTGGYLRATLEYASAEEGDDFYVATAYKPFVDVLQSYNSAYCTVLESVGFEKDDNTLVVSYEQKPKSGASDKYAKTLRMRFTVKDILSKQKEALAPVEAETPANAELLKTDFSILGSVMSTTGKASRISFTEDHLYVDGTSKYALGNDLGESAELLSGVQLSLENINIMKVVCDAGENLLLGKNKAYLLFENENYSGGIRYNRMPANITEKAFNNFTSQAKVTVERRYFVDVVKQMAVSAKINDSKVLMTLPDTAAIADGAGIRLQLNGNEEVEIPILAANSDDFEADIRISVKPDDLLNALLGDNNLLADADDEEAEYPFLDKLDILYQVEQRRVTLEFTDEMGIWKSLMALARITR